MATRLRRHTVAAMRYVAMLAALSVVVVIVGLVYQPQPPVLARPSCEPARTSEPAPDAATATRIALRQSQFVDGQVIAVHRGRASALASIPGDAFCAVQTAANDAWGVTIRGHLPWDKKRLREVIEVVDVTTGVILRNVGHEVRYGSDAGPWERPM